MRNVTDIDDKILTKAAEAARPWWEWAATHEREFHAAYDVLGCLPPSIEPRATGHVTQMVELMERLIDSGHAYAAGGDVYFDVRSFPGYGELSGQRLDESQQGETDGRRQARPARLHAVEERQAGRAGVADAVGPGPAGLAPRVLGDGRRLPRRRSSTSTAAASTWSSRTTRTSAPRATRRATRSRGSGCTTPG